MDDNEYDFRFEKHNPFDSLKPMYQLPSIGRIIASSNLSKQPSHKMKYASH